MRFLFFVPILSGSHRIGGADEPPVTAVNPPQTAITTTVEASARQWRNNRTNGICALGEAKVIEITDVEEKADTIVAAI